MWTVIYIAQNKESVDKLQAFLEKEGILVKIRPVGKKTSEEDGCFEVLVPDSEVQDAHVVMIEQGF